MLKDTHFIQEKEIKVNHNNVCFYGSLHTTHQEKSLCKDEEVSRTVTHL